MAHTHAAPQPESEDVFGPLRPWLFGIAYRMLGSVMDAEDAVQDTFLQWHTHDQTAIADAKAYLTTVMTHLCIDRLRSARVRREAYVGLWLPEPLVTTDMTTDPSYQAEQTESLSLAFLQLLEHLTPVERACFLLHEVFGYPYDAIAPIVGKSVAACRQIGARAKQHMHDQPPRFVPTPALSDTLTRAFLQACHDGDLRALMRLLANDVTAYADGDDKVHAARRPVVGAHNVARYLLGILRKSPSDVNVRVQMINGHPGVILEANGMILGAVALGITNNAIQTIWLLVNPDKLGHLARPQ